MRPLALEAKNVKVGGGKRERQCKQKRARSSRPGRLGALVVGLAGLLFVARDGLHCGAAPVVDETVASALPCAGQVGHDASPAGESSETVGLACQ